MARIGSLNWRTIGLLWITGALIFCLGAALYSAIVGSWDYVAFNMALAALNTTLLTLMLRAVR